IRYVLPYAIIRKSILRLIRFPIETLLLSKDVSVQEERAFLNAAVDFFRAIGADVIIPATFNSVFRTYPHEAIAAPYGSFVVDLDLPEELLWKRVHPKHRNVIRNASNKGV